jgi:hypothetical protein
VKPDNLNKTQKSEGGWWRELLICAVIIYGIIGFFFFVDHQNEAASAWDWTLFALSPLLLAVGGLLFYGLLMFLLVGITRLFESKWFNAYTNAINSAEAKAIAAKHKGDRLAALGWRAVMLVVALPIILVLLFLLSRAE